MSINDLNDMQRYLVEEEAEKWREGRLSRREFIRRVTLVVGGAVAASGVLLSLGCDANAADPSPAGATPTTGTSPSGAVSPYHVPEDDPAIQSEMVDIPASDASLRLKGYLAYDRNKVPQAAGPGKAGGVLVVHENRGLTPYIEDVVRRVARAGYVGLSVDLLSRAGGSATHPDEGERVGILGQVPPDLLVGDLLDGVRYLKSRPDIDPARIGAVGFCFGGGMVWRLVTQSPDVKAAVPYYGPNPPLKFVPNIKAAVLGIYAGNDSRITNGVPELDAALKGAGITYEIKIYDGTDHAFHNDTGERYNAEAAKDAWERTLAWFEQYL